MSEPKPVAWLIERVINFDGSPAQQPRFSTVVLADDNDPDERVTDPKFRATPLYPGPFRVEWAVQDSRDGETWEHEQHATREEAQHVCDLAGVRVVRRLVSEWEPDRG